MILNSPDIRRSLLKKWYKNLSNHKDLFFSDSISGSTPPTVFVGSFNYPQVYVGPMVPPFHGDTSLLDNPEKWVGKTLEEIVKFRLTLVRGIQKIPVTQTEGRYVENLQELTMASRPTDSDLQFTKKTSHILLDGEGGTYGPIGEIKSAKFSNSNPTQSIEKIFYDKDLKTHEAVVNLYNTGIDVSKIQKCFSMGMFGQKRKLVPTKWSITATDDIISKSLVEKILDYPLIDSCRVFSFEHLGNVFSLVLFPHRWIFEMTESWFSNGILGFGSDSEGAKGIDHPPSIAGGYFAAKLSVAEYLQKNKIQSGVIILREIRPEYAIPVGVWQVREGIRAAMQKDPIIAKNLDDALTLASMKTSVSKFDWLSQSKIMKMLHQKTISDFFNFN